VTLLWSDSVPAAPPGWAQRLRDLMRNASVTMLENAGALAALEAPEEVAAAIREQLKTQLRIV
jgi:pimeloyl-ACP methyl ester carboxylesterase